MTKLDDLIKELKSLGIVHIHNWHKLTHQQKKECAEFIIKLTKEKRKEGKRFADK